MLTQFLNFIEILVEVTERNRTELRVGSNLVSDNVMMTHSSHVSGIQTMIFHTHRTKSRHFGQLSSVRALPTSPCICLPQESDQGRETPQTATITNT